MLEKNKLNKIFLEEIVKRIKKALKEIKNGEVYSTEEVKEKTGYRIIYV